MVDRLALRFVIVSSSLVRLIIVRILHPILNKIVLLWNTFDRNWLVYALLNRKTHVHLVWAADRPVGIVIRRGPQVAYFLSLFYDSFLITSIAVLIVIKTRLLHWEIGAFSLKRPLIWRAIRLVRLHLLEELFYIFLLVLKEMHRLSQLL